MKITEIQLNQIIEEEIQQAIEEGWLSRFMAKSGTRGAGAGAGIGAKVAKMFGYTSLEDEATTEKEVRIGKANVKKMKKYLEGKQRLLTHLIKDWSKDFKKLGLTDERLVGNHGVVIALKRALGRINTVVKEMDEAAAAAEAAAAGAPPAGAPTPAPGGGGGAPTPAPAPEE